MKIVKNEEEGAVLLCYNVLVGWTGIFFICECVEISSCCSVLWNNSTVQYSEFVAFAGCTGVFFFSFFLSPRSLNLLPRLTLPLESLPKHYTHPVSLRTCQITVTTSTFRFYAWSVIVPEGHETGITRTSVWLAGGMFAV